MAKSKKSKRSTAASGPDVFKPRLTCPVCGQGISSDNDLVAIDKKKMRRRIAKAVRRPMRSMEREYGE